MAKSRIDKNQTEAGLVISLKLSCTEFVDEQFILSGRNWDLFIDELTTEPDLNNLD